MIEILGWVGLVLVYGVVHFYSKGEHKIGNILNLFATVCWFFVAAVDMIHSLMVLQVLMFTRSAWALKKV